METPILRLSIFSDGSYSATQPTPAGDLFRVKTDIELNRRNRFGLPMVFFFRETSCLISKEWQLYLMAINPGMTPQRVSALLHNDKAFCNGTGVGGSTERQNWILEEGISPLENNPLPAWSKCFTCGDAIVEKINGVVTMMDGSLPPALREGVFYPLTRQQALNPNSYKYSPRTHPHLFFAAKNVSDGFVARPFDFGATYPWYKDGQTPVTFLPHVTDFRDGQVQYPPQQFSGNSAVLTSVLQT